MSSNNSGALVLGALGVGVALLVFASRSSKPVDEPVKIPVPPVPPPATKPPYQVGKGWYLVDPLSFGEGLPPGALTEPLKEGDKVTYALGDDPDAKKAKVLMQVLGTATGKARKADETSPVQYEVKVELAKIVEGDPSLAPTLPPVSGSVYWQWRNKLVALNLPMV